MFDQEQTHPPDKGVEICMRLLREIKERIDELRVAAERATREGDLETASRLSYGEIPALEQDMAIAQAAEAEREVAPIVWAAFGQGGPGPDDFK